MFEILKINSQRPEKCFIQKAVKIIKKGGLVAFPTETVYGLGANALDKNAVRKIFKVKGRPLDNPIIVHIAKIEDLNLLARNIPKDVKILVQKFWPGPLTFVLFKKNAVPDEVTAGLKVVAIRMPKNKIALEMIKKAGFPIAAPSANLAGRPSPTFARHVFEDFGSKIDLILDGGRTKIGVESTVVDLTVKPFQILRPGGISFEELKKVLPDLRLHPSLLDGTFKGKSKSPGMKYRHYAPKASLILVNPIRDSKKWDKVQKGRISNGVEGKEQVLRIQNLIKKYQKQNKKVGVLSSFETKRFYQQADLVLISGSRKNLEQIAQNLFKILREFDKQKVDIILAEGVPEKGIGFAIMHRLKKASQG
ncbi:MAG: threonylcarbamoyl-AMP synthase [Candidatus Nealsonbacteria bacterium]|nr:threonylcarbamoyl-AMP synthase [Candidatus Nealsonbacteria bacterium]